MRAALLQLTSSDDPAENLVTVRAMLREAAGQGRQESVGTIQSAERTTSRKSGCSKCARHSKRRY